MPKPVHDEYNWSKYTQEYSAQVVEMEKTAGPNGSDFLVKKWDIKDNEIVFYDNLHSNWKQIYTSIFDCNPESIFECGCGGMYHLKNINTLFPNIKINGCDLLQTQIDFGAKKFNVSPEILKNVKVLDFTQPNATEGLGTYDFVYSHAVIMHLSNDNALKFMKNMTKIAQKHIFFIEGKQHNYMGLLEELGELKNFDIEHPKKYVQNAIVLHRK